MRSRRQADGARIPSAVDGSIPASWPRRLRGDQPRRRVSRERPRDRLALARRGRRARRAAERLAVRHQRRLRRASATSGHADAASRRATPPASPSTSRRRPTTTSTPHDAAQHAVLRDDRATLQTHAVTWSRGARRRAASNRSRPATSKKRTSTARPRSARRFFPSRLAHLEVNGQYGRPAASDTPGVAVGMTYRHREASVGPSGVGFDGAFFQSAPDADLVGVDAP